MTLIYSCDFCGEAIGDDDGHVRLEIVGKGNRFTENPRSDVWADGWLAHYHDDCMGEVRELLRLIGSTRSDLESIPVMEREPKPRARIELRDTAVRGSIPIDQVVTHPGVAHHLRVAGIRTLEEAAERSRYDLLSLKRVGQTTVARIESALGERGLELIPGPAPSDVGSRVRQLRISAGMSQTELARAIDEGECDENGFRRCEIHAGAIATWESGRQVIPDVWLARIASHFGVDVDAILADPNR